MMETARVLLRRWTVADAEALFKYASHPEVGPAAGWPPHSSVAESLEIIQTVFSAPEVYAIVLKETGEPVGSCGIMFADGVHSAAMGECEAEIGYWIGRPYWGLGITTEAVLALKERAFADLGMRALWIAITTVTTARGAWPRSAALYTIIPSLPRSRHWAISAQSIFLCAASIANP